MNRADLATNYGNGSSLVPARRDRDPSALENKSVQVFQSNVPSQGSRRSAQPSMKVNLPPVDVVALTDPQFIALVQMESERRGLEVFFGNQIEQVDEKKVGPFLGKFAENLEKPDWKALGNTDRELRRESAAVREEVLNRLAADFANAMVRACKDQNHEGLDAIYKAIGDSPAFLQMMIQAINDTDLLNHYSRGVERLLSKDRSETNWIMVEARSRVIAKILLNSNVGNYFPILETGPVFFLSDDENRFNFPDYAATRKALVQRFQQNVHQDTCSIFLKCTPNRLPLDALEIFPKNIASWPDLKLSILNFLNRCPDSLEKTTLMNRCNRK